MAWWSVRDAGGLCFGVRRVWGRPGRVGREKRIGVGSPGLKAGPTKNGNSSAQCKRSRWRLHIGVVECEWRGRIASLRAASGGPPGKRESGWNGSWCVYPLKAGPTKNVTLQRNASDRGGDWRMAWWSVRGAGGLCFGVRRVWGRPRRVGREKRIGVCSRGLKAGPTKNGNSLAQCKRSRWRLHNGVVGCEWRGRIASLRAASGGPPGKRESGSNGSRCVYSAQRPGVRKMKIKQAGEEGKKGMDR